MLAEPIVAKLPDANTIVLSLLALTTLYNSIVERLSKRRVEQDIAKQAVILDSVKVTGDKTHTLSNSNMGEQLLAVVTLTRAVAALSDRQAAISNAEADLAASKAAHAAVATAEERYQRHQENQAIVDAADISRQKMNAAILERAAQNK